MSKTADFPQIILASSSVFRRQLLEKLHIPFQYVSPDIDETRLSDESLTDMIDRLSLAKAKAVADSHQNCIIIASDQSAFLNNEVLCKPGNYETAFQQLQNANGQMIEFHTGLVVLDNRTTPMNTQCHHDITRVHFRNLSNEQIHNYLTLEEPYQCAGSFKSEGLGITLFSKIESTDPNALIGLPLIALTDCFNNLGIQLPFLAKNT